MIETYLKEADVDGVKQWATFTKIENLKEWDKNEELKVIGPVGYENLKNQIKEHGPYKPLLVDPDGIVIGGNHRLKAFKELGHTEAWISVKHAATDEDKLKLSLSDNDHSSFYNDSALANYTSQFPDIDLSAYTVDFTEGINLGSLTQLGEESKEDHPVKEKKEVECPSCHNKFVPD